MPLSDNPMVRPFDPARFAGQIAYDGATEIKFAALAAHPSGEVALLSLVGNDTAISSRLATLFLGEKKLAFVPAEDLGWDGPLMLGRVFGNYKQCGKRLPGIRNTANWMVVANNLRIGFNLQNPPDIPEELLKQPAEGQTGETPVLIVKTERPPTYRYVAATLNAGDEPAPSYGAVVGTLVGMRAIVLRPRQAETRIVARQWADALWQHGIEKGLIQRLPSAGVAVWAMKNALIHWNMLVSEGVSDGWLPVPRRTPSMLLPGPPMRAVAAD